MARTKIYSDPAFLPSGVRHAEMLFPFWGACPEPPEMADAGRFDRYTQVGTEIFAVAESFDEADVAVLPTDWKRYVRSGTEQLALDFIEQAARHGKRTVVFFFSDLDTPIPIDNSILFRTSMLRSQRHPNEHSLPAWSVDYVTKVLGGELPIRPKRARPTIGFCGNAVPRPISAPTRIKRTLSRLFSYVGLDSPGMFLAPEHYLELRRRVLNAVRNHSGLEPNFLIRNSYFGGALRNKVWDSAVLETVRSDFLNNLTGSDYALCVRGSGNFSFRLFEALSCGRIPILVDTDCVLPYDDQIGWRELLVWVDVMDVEKLGDIITDFHQTLSNKQFLDLQRECREVWEKWLSPEGFFANLYRCL